MEAKMIDALLSDRPDDRRELFEEAAGVGLYRDRRRTTERRLEETTVDLQRLDDLIAEVQGGDAAGDAPAPGDCDSGFGNTDIRGYVATRPAAASPTTSARTRSKSSPLLLRPPNRPRTSPPAGRGSPRPRRGPRR